VTTYTGTSGEDTIHGSKFDDIMFGGADDDFLLGRAGNDYIDGGSGNDVLHGDAGNDTLVGGQGDDFIHGGTGTDTAVYSGSVLDYSFGSDGENFFVYHTGGTQADGDDRLLHVERLQFNDILIDLTQNNGPLAFDDVASTDEDVGTYSSGSASVLDNDFDWEGDSLTATPGTFNGTYGTLVLSADGTYTYTPYGSTQSLALGETVQDSFSYTVSDGSLSDTGTLTINIAGRNDAPVANDDTASTTEDASVSGNVLANDTDVDASDTLVVATPGTYVGAYGTLVLAADGSYTYTPNAAAQGLDDGEVANDAFAYTASDGNATDTATLTITVNGLNDAPVANDDTASATEDAAVSGNVLANDTDVDGETLTVTNPGTYVGAYGTLVLAADGSYTYTPNAANQALDDGEMVQDSFTYTASDGTASDSATLTVTVNGLNDAPVANDDTASTTEDASVSGNVLTNDTDIDGETLTVATPGTYFGTYGTLTLAADGSYTYAPGAAAQGLDTGETAQDVFTYTASDGTASDTATLTVNVAGLNDAPVANDDTATTTEDDAVSGNVLANDTDVDGETLTVTNPGTYIGAYGMLVLAANGNYTYTPGAAAQALDEGESVNDVFSYVASDGTLSDTATLTITVTGLGGVPDANDDAATTTENASVSGNVLTNDTDDDGDPLTVSNPGTYVGTYGTLTLAANGSYTYTPNAAANGLAAGETAQDAFTYTATDGTGSDTATLTVTVNGTNDAPTIDAGGTDATGSVSELPDGNPGEGTTIHTDSGTVAFDDVDVNDTHSASFTPQGGGYYGTFTLDPVDQMGDGVGWDFTVSDAALEGLSAGQVVTQTYTVQIDDGNGGTVTQDVTITINGAGVGVGPQTVWYIDNSDVTSANLGTQADPYTSIAAFNAAQGTLGGPQVGHTVNLLAGTGTGIYAEADGINLLNGQTLNGVATGPVRPTIEAAAGDGVNVAQNNNVSGLDIGNTSGADIADSGGSVGTLTMTDVGTSGTGQVIDIDQGGTLAVTLNTASSLASAGGAIDLAGVGGSFTVTGATTITGVHSGGGVDVTGSSVAVNLSGGGTVSTAGATAVNFVGNTGSLEIGGGLDIVTTSGAGLNATGGGTVTATGAGNSVTTTTGTAVTISGTTIGAGDVTLESVSSTGAVNGIVLSNTGALGGLTITGTGIAGSGGVIANSTGSAILATNTQDLNLAWITIQSPAGHGILATNLRGDNTLADSIVSGFGAGGGNLMDGLRIINNNTDMGSFTVTNTTFSNGAAGNDGIFMEAQGTSDMTLEVDNSTFTGLFGDGIQVNGNTGATGDLNVTVANSDFVNAAASGSGGVALSSLGGVTLRALVEANLFDDIMRVGTNSGAVNATNGGTATAHVTIRDNIIEDIVGARGINFSADGGTSFLAIDGNSVDRLGGTARAGVNVNFTNNAVGDVTIIDNFIGQNGNLWTAGNGNANAILVNAQNTASVDSLIDGNLVTGNTNVELVRVRSINTATVNATVTDNTLTDTAGAHVEFDATAGLAAGSSVLNLNIHDNILPGAGVGVIRFADLAGGVLNVTQLSAADVSSENSGATVSLVPLAGMVFYGQPAPPLPIYPDMPFV